MHVHLRSLDPAALGLPGVTLLGVAARDADAGVLGLVDEHLPVVDDLRWGVANAVVAAALDAPPGTTAAPLPVPAQAPPAAVEVDRPRARVIRLDARRRRTA